MRHDSQYVARYRDSDGMPQSVQDHLEGVSTLAASYTGKIGLPTIGELMGLLHDLGKYSAAFQSYLQSSEGKIEPDEEEYVDAGRMKGKIDHSTAGAQYLREQGKKDSRFWQIATDIMALCIASHHSGLIDCLASDGADVFTKRMQKPGDKTHFAEVDRNLEEQVRNRVQALLTSTQIENEMRRLLERLGKDMPSLEIGQFMLGFLTRFLFSALIDADRLNSAERKPANKPDWQPLIDLLEIHLAGFTVRNRIDEIRADISESCLQSAARGKGLIQLTVPTGGGKTLASLRFALHHAAKHGMDRIIYVVPYTSIIDQNARVARSVFAALEKNGRQIVLEHHSNLTPEQDTNESKLLAENWNVPIIYTTAVQFLETLFAAGTRGVRRLHQLANAVIIFDEIQTIPIRTIHLFNNAINFMVGQCGSTVVFCTATQPILDRVDPKKGAARLASDAEMMPNVGELFRDLHRARIEDHCKDTGWTEEAVAETALQELESSGSVLIIVNKKTQAKALYQRLHDKLDHVYHLSTSMCPAHRTAILDKVKACLNPENPLPVICISTQLIEAGVDVDFGTVIRYLAGLDSIAQAAGRCNRNGLRKIGRVLIVNPANEGLDRLPEIRNAQDVTKRVLREFKDNPDFFNRDLQSPKSLERYYDYYFFQRAGEMDFPVSDRDIRNMPRQRDTLLNLLSKNEDSVQIYLNEHKQAPSLYLRQSFMSAARAFKAIDSPSQGVIVPYGAGERIIADLSASGFDDKGRLLKEAQRYSVNLFPYELEKLKEQRRLYEVWSGSGIYCLDERHYSEEFGVSMEPVADMKLLIVSGGDNEEPY
ncbi:CRISPR-associated nuclease and helicase Cas3 [Geotalea daltonii FRC-32]|uniref:CRISPR-associated nuclease and helicase Cas3 n=1 Tax=Geotalea daltonii (strain DSM 22248 / JCM 15807 / FRC-32) TaxID=316067 RepID=B9M5K0_GEODF|nr:CRISPR-associated helicase/endonuclease Cas3 [Geotalea daltonii]ACM21759.1 CRISPR-associated nuclease and helicase Cas3 [Geotalea daltonii FRC-32]